MEKQPFRTTKNQRVRLKLNGVDNIYAKAYAGSEGWIRDQRHDDLGYPIVFIEWDKNHWTYNGEADKWTLEAHFDPIEESKMAEEQPQFDPNQFAAMMGQFAQWMADQQQDKKSNDPAPGDAPSQEENAREHYRLAWDEAKKIADNASSFLLLTVHKGQDGSWTPIVVSEAVDSDAALIAEMQVSRLAAEIATQLGYEVMAAREKHDA
jgi:hypothetical protein